ncbi:Secoisolariciresinol dehydrogenase, partial [Lachnellula cervina]
MPSPVILILGAGPNIGHHVAKTFAASGYKVAIAARSVKEAESTDSQLNIPSDFTKSEDVVNAFSKVKKVFGIPSVVVYNVSSSTRPPPDDPFSLPLADFSKDLSINVTSLYVAAQQAVAGFAQL